METKINGSQVTNRNEFELFNQLPNNTGRDHTDSPAAIEWQGMVWR